MVNAPIMVAPNWDLPFELMCDASDYALGAVLGQRKNKQFQPIYYTSRTLNDTQQITLPRKGISSSSIYFWKVSFLSFSF